MSLSLISRSKPKHRAAGRKKPNGQTENQMLVRQVLGAMEYIGQLELVNACLADTAKKVTEQRDTARSERDGFEVELGKARMLLTPFLAAEANANAITVPPAERDTTAIEDQATAPIKVTTLWAAHGIGPVVRTEGSTDPAHLPAA
ncbi:hypothetical protein [Streptomyces sp. 020-2-3H-GM]|uniref:hypothetical protein n=1 Tax=Streptomyces sp. 020-2-3H-GM TaxID=2789258 RepID=UPI00398133F7